MNDDVIGRGTTVISGISAMTGASVASEESNEGTQGTETDRVSNETYWPGQQGQAEGVEDMQSSPIVAWLREEDEQTRSRQASFKLSLVAIAVGGLVMVGSLIWMGVTQPQSRLISGPIVAEHYTHRVEGVSHTAPSEPVRFLLQVRGAPLVTEVLTDLDCVRAQIIQGSKASQWFTKASFEGKHSAGVQMLPFQPAYLEVRIEPSTLHPGEEKELNHNIVVKTADGQVLAFEVATAGK